jgi:zinc protease
MGRGFLDPTFVDTGNIAFEEFTLENGLRVILHEDHKSAVVCLNIAYHVGSKNESVERRGFAHLFEHLLFDGSKNVPRGAFDLFIAQAGGHDNAYTTEDKTNYYEVLPTHQLELGLWLESDRMLEFGISEISLTTQKHVVKEEKLERYDNTPYGSLSIHINRLAYRKFPYWWAVIGDMETIDAATLLDVRNFFETFYVPNNAVLVLTGDFDRTQAIQAIEHYFSGIPRGKTPIERPPFDEPEQIEERRQIITEEPVPLPGVFYAYRVPSEGTPEYLALDLATDILSSGQSSRLYKKLIYELQIASEASSYMDGREMPGLAYIYAVARELEGDISTIERAVEDVIADVVQHGVSEQELEKAKNKTEARLVASRITVQGKADQLAHAAIFYNNTARVNTILSEYREVTVEQVRAAVEKYFRPTNRSTVVYQPPEALLTNDESAASDLHSF